MDKDQVKILCVTCPKGCSLEVTKEGDTVLEVKPGCKRGHEYAKRELVDPRRMVATSIRIKCGVHPLLPVYTSAPFPKPRIMELQAKLRKVELRAPIKMGTVVVQNILDTGIDIIASRDMDAVNKESTYIARSLE
jgi:CxxC motif-containing protein